MDDGVRPGGRAAGGFCGARFALAVPGVERDGEGDEVLIPWACNCAWNCALAASVRAWFCACIWARIWAWEIWIGAWKGDWDWDCDGGWRCES